MTAIEPVTVQEAQFLVDRPIEEINKAIERGEVKTMLELVTSPAKVKRKAVRRGPRGRRARATTVHGYAPPKTVTHKVRKLGPEGLVYLALGRDVQESLTPLGRRRLFDAISTSPSGTDKVSIGLVHVQLKDARAKLLKRYRALRDVRTGIEERGSAEPVFRGTDIKVYQIAALVEGQGVDDTLDDYPSLKRKQALRALDYARAYPKKGRPYPARSLKRAVGDLAAASVFALGDDAPRLGLDDFR